MDGQRGCNTPHQCGDPNILQQETSLLREGLCQIGEAQGLVSSGMAYSISGQAYGHLHCCRSRPELSFQSCPICRCSPETSSGKPVPVCRASVMSVYLDDDSICTTGCNGPDGKLRSLKLLVKKQDVEGNVALYPPLVQIVHDLPVAKA